MAILLYAIALSNIGWAANPWQLSTGPVCFSPGWQSIQHLGEYTGVMAEKIYSRPIISSFHGAWSIAGFTGALIDLLMMNFKITPRAHFCIVIKIVFTIYFFARKYLIPGTTASAEKNKFFSRPDGILLRLGIIAFCCMASEGAMFDWSGVYFKEVVKTPQSLVIAGYASFMIMMATGRFVGDSIIAKLGRKKTLQLS